MKITVEISLDEMKQNGIEETNELTVYLNKLADKFKLDASSLTDREKAFLIAADSIQKG